MDPELLSKLKAAGNFIFFVIQFIGNGLVFLIKLSTNRQKVNF